MAAQMTGATATAGWAQLRRGRWLAAIVAAVLAALYLGAITSTHAALSGGFTGWFDVIPGHGAGLGFSTAAQRAQLAPTGGYSGVLWATGPGGEVSFGLQVHNAGPVPVTILGLALRPADPGVIYALAPAGGPQAGAGFGQLRPLRPVTIGPGSSLAAALTVRVACDRILRADARIPGAGTSVIGDATSPVVVRYRVLGVTMSQTVSVATPVLIALQYRACR